MIEKSTATGDYKYNTPQSDNNLEPYLSRFFVLVIWEEGEEGLHFGDTGCGREIIRQIKLTRKLNILL